MPQILKEMPICTKGNATVFVVVALKEEHYGQKSKECYLAFKTNTTTNNTQTLWTSEDLKELFRILEQHKVKELTI